MSGKIIQQCHTDSVALQPEYSIVMLRNASGTFCFGCFPIQQTTNTKWYLESAALTTCALIHHSVMEVWFSSVVESAQQCTLTVGDA